MRFLLATVMFVIASPAFANDPLTDFFNQAFRTKPVQIETTGSTRKFQQRLTPTGHVKATWYKSGHKTANGERFNPHGITVAHKTLPFGTRVLITNPSNNRSIVARVNDRGPFRRGYAYDLSMGTARAIGFSHGVVHTSIVH